MGLYAARRVRWGAGCLRAHLANSFFTILTRLVGLYLLADGVPGLMERYGHLPAAPTCCRLS